MKILIIVAVALVAIGVAYYLFFYHYPWMKYCELRNTIINLDECFKGVVESCGMDEVMKCKNFVFSINNVAYHYYGELDYLKETIKMINSYMNYAQELRRRLFSPLELPVEVNEINDLLQDYLKMYDNAKKQA